MMQAYSTLRLELNARVATLTLARPARGNALGAQSGRDLRDAFTRIGANADIDALLIAAEGSAFCVGGDIGEFAGVEDLASTIQSMVSDFHAACDQLARLKIPVIAVVQGATAGAGLTFVALADHVIASPEATFTYAYPKLGLSSDGGLTWLLPRIMGLRNFQNFVLSGSSWSAAEAQRAGLISEVCEIDIGVAARVAMERFAKRPGRALGVIRSLGFTGLSQRYDLHLGQELAEIVTLAGSAATQDAIKAALQRLSPVEGK